MTDVFMDKGGWTQTGTQGGHDVEIRQGSALQTKAQ